ncbi:MAG: hypothetical protein LBN39_06970 [Planctomycetaceae bacterium]|jgi:hypothetical protein|nr:hypothetical protein [Planctomycetaceae bacterium]
MLRFVLSVFFFGIAFPVVAQDADQLLKTFQSSRWRFEQEAQDRPAQRSAWEGRGSWMALRFYLRGDEADLDLTQEQSEKFAFLRKDNEFGGDWFRKKIEEKDPVFMAAIQAQQQAMQRNDAYFDNLSGEERKEVLAAASATIAMWLGDMQQTIETTLTPEQMQKVRSMELELMNEMGLPNPAMFEPLGLSDEQKKQMSEIKEEMEKEFDKLLDESMDLRQERFRESAKYLAETFKDQKPASRDDVLKAHSEGISKADKNEALKKRYAEHNKRGSDFANRLKFCLMDVLTDEQLDKMQDLQDNAPNFVKKMLAGMKQEREVKEKKGQYVPGPDSWKPGDGTPKDFKEERKALKAFPTKEN